VVPPPTVASQPRTNPPPSAYPESIATTPRVANPPAALRVVRAPESTAVNPNLRAPSETEARVIADSIIQMIERRQVARFTRFGQEDPAKARANLVRFLERNHPSARVAGRLQVAEGRSAF